MIGWLFRGRPALTMMAAAQFCGWESLAVRAAVRGGSVADVLVLAVGGSFFLTMLVIYGYQAAVEGQARLEQWRRAQRSADSGRGH